MNKRTKVRVRSLYRNFVERAARQLKEAPKRMRRKDPTAGYMHEMVESFRSDAKMFFNEQFKVERKYYEQAESLSIWDDPTHLWDAMDLEVGIVRKRWVGTKAKEALVLFEVQSVESFDLVINGFLYYTNELIALVRRSHDERAMTLVDDYLTVLRKQIYNNYEKLLNP